MAGCCRAAALLLVFLLDIVGSALSIVGRHRGAGAAGGGATAEDVAIAAALAGRLLGVSLLALLAVRCALGRWPQCCCSLGGGRRRRGGSGGARDLPLLEGGGLSLVEAPAAAAAAEPQSPSSSPVTGDERARQIDGQVAAQAALLRETKSGLLWRNALLVLSYAFIAGCSVRIAAVVVAMDFSSAAEALAAGGYLASLVMMNVEFIILRGWVMDVTVGDAVHMAGVHDHPLYWADVEGKGYSVCSRCNEKLGAKVGGYLTLQCRKCVPNQYGWGGFQICMHCYRKVAAKQGDGADRGAGGAGILIGDKGPKAATQLSVLQFVVRLAALVNLSSTLACLLCVVAAQIVNTYIPKAQGDCINALVEGSEGTFMERMQVYVIFVLASSLLGFAKSVCVQTLSTRLYNNMSVTLFKALMSQDIAFYDNAMTGQLNSRLTTDLRQATSPVSIILNSFIGNTVQLVAGFAICLHSSWRLTLLAFTCLTPVIHITREFSHWACKLLAAQYTYLADAQGAATQALTNIRTVRAFGALPVEFGKYEGHMTKSMHIGLRSAWGMGFSTLLSDLVQQCASLIILYYGGHLALGHGSFTVGSIITFSYLWNMLSGAFQGLMDNLNQPVKAMSAGQRVFEILDLKPDIPETVGEAFPHISEPITLELENLDFTYLNRPDKKVLNSVNISVAAGKTTAIVGKSGCGKSTITKLLLRFYDPQGGRILVNGRRLQDMNVQEFRSNLGLVSQDTQLFRCTIFENITYGLEPGSVSQADAERAAVLANADEFIRALPEGYTTMVGEGGHDLSGGQKQRLSIARSLVRRPRLLLLDEATSALDAENEALVQAALDHLMKEMQGSCTIVVIAHRLSTIREADHIIVMHEGEKVEEGKHDELLEKDGRYAALTLRQRQDQAGGGQAPAGEGEGEGEGRSARQTEEEVKRLIKALPADQQGDVLKGLFSAFRSAMMKR